MKHVMPADNRHETFAVDQCISAIKCMLEHRATPGEVHKLLGQRLPSELFNEGLQTPPVTSGECKSPEVAPVKRSRLKHLKSPLKIKLTRTRKLWVSFEELANSVPIYLVMIVSLFWLNYGRRFSFLTEKRGALFHV
jgi:hypothetical protein